MATIIRKSLAGIIACAVLWASTIVPANAQSQMRTVSDPSGRYTISFPTAWQVVSMNATPVAGEIVNHLGKNFFSMLMAIDPGASAIAPTVLMVMSLPLQTAISRGRLA